MTHSHLPLSLSSFQFSVNGGNSLRLTCFLLISFDGPDSTPELQNYEPNTDFRNFLDMPYVNYISQDNHNNPLNTTHFQLPDNTFFLQPPEFYNPCLPDLLSLENFGSKKHSRPPSPPQQPQTTKDDYSLNSILENYRKNSKEKKKKKMEIKRNFRHKMSEKIYSLGKLLPGGHRHRKNTAAMLEEAEKYAKFLEAQVNALRSMPTESKLSELRGVGVGVGRQGEELEKLSRQQLLQVVINSPVAQMVMADNGWCLVSAEQLDLMNRIQARQKVIQQLLNNIPL